MGVLYARVDGAWVPVAGPGTAAPLLLPEVELVTLTSTHHPLQTGATEDNNLAIDGSTIQSRVAGGADTLRLNNFGGNVQVGSDAQNNYLSCQRVQVRSETAASLIATSVPVQIGRTNALHVVGDKTGFQARAAHNGTTHPATTLQLNPFGGDVTVNAKSLPRGYIGYGTGATTDQAGFGSTATTLGGGVTWTADPTRRYKTTMTVNVGAATVATIANGSIAGVAAPGRVSSISLAAGEYCQHTLVAVESGLSGSVSRSPQIWFSAGTASYIGTFGRFAAVLVEDIGSV